MKVTVAGVGSAFPAGPALSTANLCLPGLRGRSVIGDRHGRKARRSTLHSKVAPGSLEAKVKVGVRSLVFRVRLVIVVSGFTAAACCGRPGGVGGGESPEGEGSCCSAPSRLSRPPLTLLPASEGLRSTPASKAPATSAGDE